MSRSLSFKECQIQFNYNPRIRALVLNWSDLPRDVILRREFRRILRCLVIRAHAELFLEQGLITPAYEDVTMWTDDLGESHEEVIAHRVGSRFYWRDPSSIEGSSSCFET